MYVSKEIQKNITILSKKEDKYSKCIERYIASDLKNLKKFYKISCPKIDIELFYSRKEFNNRIGRSTPDWLVGFARKNTIYLFSPSIIEKVSSHKKTKVKKILIHELSHIFNNKINKNILTWVDEGTAMFVAKQNKKKDFTKKNLDFFSNNFFDKDIDLDVFAKNNGYKISYWAIKTFIKKYNKNKLLKLIKVNSKKNNCEKEIEKIIGIPKEIFLKMLNKNTSLSE